MIKKLTVRWLILFVIGVMFGIMVAGIFVARAEAVDFEDCQACHSDYQPVAVQAEPINQQVDTTVASPTAIMQQPDIAEPTETEPWEGDPEDFWEPPTDEVVPPMSAEDEAYSILVGEANAASDALWPLVDVYQAAASKQYLAEQTYKADPTPENFTLMQLARQECEAALAPMLEAYAAYEAAHEAMTIWAEE